MSAAKVIPLTVPRMGGPGGSPPNVSNGNIQLDDDMMAHAQNLARQRGEPLEKTLGLALSSIVGFYFGGRPSV